MTIWVDADASEDVIKRKFFVRAAEQMQLPLILWLPIGPCACRLRVLSARSAWPPGLTLADNEIVRQCEKRAIW